MIYNDSLGIDMEDIYKLQQANLSPYLDEPFKWRSEYLPVIVAFGGIIGLALILKIRRKKKRGKKK